MYVAVLCYCQRPWPQQVVISDCGCVLPDTMSDSIDRLYRQSIDSYLCCQEIQAAKQARQDRLLVCLEALYMYSLA